MQLFPITPIVVLLLAAFAVRGTDKALGFVVVMMPFGMLAVVVLSSVGGLSLLGMHIAAAALVALVGLQAAVDLTRGKRLFVPMEALFLALFAVYALISATLLVRLFAGAFDVFPLSRGVQGEQISIFFRSTLAPVGPSNSNLSQAAYVLLSFAFFVAAVSILRRSGVIFMERWLRYAAIINIALGAMDLVGLDAVLSLVRTATYALANEQVIVGIGRTVGGYPEPSSFGGFSAVLFAYFAATYAYSRRPIDGLIALGNLALVLLSLAASAFLGLAAVVLVGGAVLLTHVAGPYHRNTTLLCGTIVCGMIAALSVALISTGLAAQIERIISATILDKAQSESGLERGAWALYGLKAFVSSHGLGAGVGSLRSNGLLPVLLGSVGVPGALAFAAFLVAAFLRHLPRTAPAELRRVFVAARLAACCQLTTMLVSGTTPDPGIVLLTFAALATSARIVSRPSRSADDAAAHASSPWPRPAGVAGGDVAIR